MKRGVPYSRKKARIRDTILYWKAYIRRTRGGIINVEVIERRRDLHNIDASGEVNIEIASQKLQECLKEQEDMKENRTKYREKYILDYHHTNIEEDFEE